MDATVSDSLVGRVLDARYRVEARIARGGMATVYQALDVRLDRTVALKVMHPLFAQDDEFVARFIREAKAAARLSHPNVVAVFDQGDDDGHVFLAMEYVPGRTLRDLLHERHQLPPQEALSILTPVLSALAAAHEAGLIHRDIKPENVLLSDDRRVKVADFGLARAAASRSVTSTNTLIGTVAYLAPEQVSRGVADPRSDVYAAGILLFEMLTGRPPYEGETPISVAVRHTVEDVPAPSSVVPGMPPSVDALVQHATARDPDRRPRDAGAFLAETARVRRSLPALDADAGSATTFVPRTHETLVVELPHDANNGRSRNVSAGSPPQQPPTARPRRRRRWGLIALALVLLLAGGAAGAGWYYGLARYTTVPSLDRLTAAQAQAKATAAHVKLTTGASQYDAAIPAGQVMSQSPSPAAKIRRDATVTIELSKGRHVVTVPPFDPASTSFTAYAAALEKVGLHAVQPPTLQYSDTVPNGNVMAVSNDPGSQLDYNASVTVTVSQGPQPIAILDYTGKRADQAQAALTSAGFHVTVTKDFSDTVAAGDVISQTPKSGNGTKGQTITLDVSKGPQLFKVPDVTSDLANPMTWVSIDEAKKILTDAGFQVKVGKHGRFGVVTKETPKGGSMEPKGTVITIDAS